MPVLDVWHTSIDWDGEPYELTRFADLGIGVPADQAGRPGRLSCRGQLAPAGSGSRTVVPGRGNILVPCSWQTTGLTRQARRTAGDEQGAARRRAPPCLTKMAKKRIGALIMIFALAMWEPQPDPNKMHACGLRGSNCADSCPSACL